MRRAFTSFEGCAVLFGAILIVVILPLLNVMMDASYSASQVTDPAGLAAKLVAHADPLSDVVWQTFPPELQQVLSDPKSTPAERQSALIVGLNKVLPGDSIYSEERFTGVSVSPETLKLSSQKPQGEDRVWLNRMLLDDGYSHELKKAHYVAVPELLRVSNTSLNVYGKYLCYAVLAISVDLLWGYTGLLCLGQCLFFALGGYMMGMYLMRMIGTLGQYHQPIPDFLVFLGWHTLPPFWKPFSSFPFAVLMAFLLPGLLALMFGYLAFRSRIRGVYFSILTQALTYASTLLFYRNNILMGGNNGFTDYKFLLGYDVRLPSTQRALYICSGLLVLFTYLLCKWVTVTKFGKVQRAIRDHENRVLFSGYATANYKLFVFVLCALIASMAGMLYVPQVGIINPSEMEPGKSIEAVVWVAIGGRGTLVGPVVGAIFVGALKTWATRAFPDLWLIILGLLFIFVVLFMPKGLVGVFGQLREVFLKFKGAPPEEDSKPPDESVPLAKPAAIAKPPAPPH